MLSTILAFLAAPFLFKPATAPQNIGDGGTTWVDPRSIDGMIAFFESRNPKEAYNWGSGSTCALAQWGKSFKSCYAGACLVMTDHWGVNSINAEIDIAMASPNTFEGAAKRARKFKHKYGL